MQVWSWVQHHRWLCVGLLAFLVLSTAGGTAWAVFFRTVASPVTLRDALRQYRETQPGQSTLAGQPGAAARPFTPGVFGYATSGGESLNLPGADRSVPSHTDMIITDAPATAADPADPAASATSPTSATSAGCSSVSWVPLVQHTETTTACPSIDHSIALSSAVTQETIAGTNTTTVIDCPATAYLVPPIAATGVQWSATCHQVNPAQTVMLTGLVVGGTDIDVGGQTIHTVHVRLTLVFNGVEVGTSPTDYWISTAKGLLVRESETAHINQGSFHYQEQMQSTLESLTPTS
jgi:hypothetical protein